MAEYPQRNRSASEYLEMMAELVPCLNDLIAGDVGVSVIRDGRYIAYMPADTLGFKNKIGDPVKGAVSRRCLESGRPESSIVPKEQSPYGVAYAANAIPFKDTNIVVGCATTTIRIDKQEKIIATSNEVAASAQELTRLSREVAQATRQISCQRLTETLANKRRLGKLSLVELIEQ